MLSDKPENIDAYIARFPGKSQLMLEQIRKTIKKAVPNAEETISYGIPTITLNGHYLIYFAGYKNHISLYPAPRGNELFKDELVGYKGGKDIVQFSLDTPLPSKLITRIVKFRIQEKSILALKKPYKKRKLKEVN